MRVLRCAILLATGALGGCGRTPMSYLTTNGPAADAAARLGWGLIALSSAVSWIRSMEACLGWMPAFEPVTKNFSRPLWRKLLITGKV